MNIASTSVTPARSRRLRWLALSAIAALTTAWGCAGYQVGARTLFRPDIQTVNVQVFESASFRRGLGEWLTEAVIKEIESRSHYKVVHSPVADSVLTGRIVTVEKGVLSENINDDPRNVEMGFQVQIVWRDRQGRLLSNRGGVPLPTPLINLALSADFVPEGGQSVTTAEQEAIRRLAREIVNQMESPW